MDLSKTMATQHLMLMKQLVLAARSGSRRKKPHRIKFHKKRRGCGETNPSNAMKRANIIVARQNPDVERMTNWQNTRFHGALSQWRAENPGKRVPSKVYNKLAERYAGLARA